MREGQRWRAAEGLSDGLDGALFGWGQGPEEKNKTDFSGGQGRHDTAPCGAANPP